MNKPRDGAGCWKFTHLRSLVSRRPALIAYAELNRGSSVALPSAPCSNPKPYGAGRWLRSARTMSPGKRREGVFPDKEPHHGDLVPVEDAPIENALGQDAAGINSSSCQVRDQRHQKRAAAPILLGCVLLPDLNECEFAPSRQRGVCRMIAMVKRLVDLKSPIALIACSIEWTSWKQVRLQPGQEMAFRPGGVGMVLLSSGTRRLCCASWILVKRF